MAMPLQDAQDGGGGLPYAKARDALARVRNRQQSEMEMANLQALLRQQPETGGWTNMFAPVRRHRALQSAALAQQQAAAIEAYLLPLKVQGLQAELNATQRQSAASLQGMQMAGRQAPLNEALLRSQISRENTSREGLELDNFLNQRFGADERIAGLAEQRAQTGVREAQTRSLGAEIAKLEAEAKNQQSLTAQREKLLNGSRAVEDQMAVPFQARFEQYMDAKEQILGFPIPADVRQTYFGKARTALFRKARPNQDPLELQGDVLGMLDEFIDTQMAMRQAQAQVAPRFQDAAMAAPLAQPAAAGVTIGGRQLADNPLGLMYGGAASFMSGVARGKRPAK